DFAELHAPQLRSFIVTSTASSIQSEPINLLGGLAPRLQRLDIRPITIFWSSGLSPSSVYRLGMVFNHPPKINIFKY
ncbi:hypothetical protein FRC03_006867, partial [Tulasnella sp. 419]